MKNIFNLITLSIVIFYSSLNAQWVQTNGRWSGVEALAVSGTNLFAGTYGSGVVFSTDNGAIWSPVNTGLPFNFIYSLAVNGTNIYAGTAGRGVYLSTNNGTSWNAANIGMENTVVLSIAVSPNGTGGTNIFAGTLGSNGITAGGYLSTDNGTSWKNVLPLRPDSAVDACVVGPNGKGSTNIFAGTDAGVFLSTDYGISWNSESTGLTILGVLALAARAPMGRAARIFSPGTAAAYIFPPTMAQSGILLATGRALLSGLLSQAALIYSLGLLAACIFPPTTVQVGIL